MGIVGVICCCIGFLVIVGYLMVGIFVGLYMLLFLLIIDFDCI